MDEVVVRVLLLEPTKHGHFARDEGKQRGRIVGTARILTNLAKEALQDPVTVKRIGRRKFLFLETRLSKVLHDQRAGNVQALHRGVKEACIDTNINNAGLQVFPRFTKPRTQAIVSSIYASSVAFLDSVFAVVVVLREGTAG